MAVRSCLNTEILPGHPVTPPDRASDRVGERPEGQSKNRLMWTAAPNTAANWADAQRPALRGLRASAPSRPFARS